jgi:hypothetical protein
MLTPMFAASPLHCPPKGREAAKGGLSEAS